jgi:hypothetical protein
LKTNTHLTETHVSGLERSDGNKGEPDHAASPLQQEQKRLKQGRRLSGFGAKRQKQGRARARGEPSVREQTTLKLEKLFSGLERSDKERRWP